MIYEKQPGVPKFECFEYEKRKKDYDCAKCIKCMR